MGADELLDEDEELLELEEEDELLDSSSLVSFTTGAGSCLGASVAGADLVDEEDELLELEEEDELDSSSFFSCVVIVGVTAGCAGYLLLELELEDEDSSLAALSVLAGCFSSLTVSCTTYFWRRANHSAFASAVSANKSQSEYFPSEF